MPEPIVLRFRDANGESRELPVTLDEAGAGAADKFERIRGTPGVHLLLTGDRDYAVSVVFPIEAHAARTLDGLRGRVVRVVFAGRTPVRRRVREVAAAPFAMEEAVATPLDLTGGLPGAPPLWLLPDGRFATSPGPAPTGLDAGLALVTAARWVSSRRTTTFERLFPPSAFHPDEPLRPERLTAEGARGLLGQLRGALGAAAVSGDAAKKDPLGAAQIRSAALTVLSHLVATVLHDESFREIAAHAAAEMFAIVDAEHGDAAQAALRSHAIKLLSLRAPALDAAARERARELVRGLLREAPPYAELGGPYRFAMCSDPEFHEGECDILVAKYGFREITPPTDAPRSPVRSRDYRVLEAPFRNASAGAVQVFARGARPDDENLEMAEAGFVGLFVNRHAQLGAYDMRAVSSTVRQSGYKIMMNAQCAGLTTRFAITHVFPDADIYSSWDSTYFRTDASGKVNASEGIDCFVALLQGMCAGETHAQIEAHVRGAQWHHPQAKFPGFSQFVGPGNPLVVARFQDVNRDGRADLYDGFLDFTIADIAENLRASLTPKDPGVRPSQIGGEAATGLGWAAGSMNRVTQYSDIWAGLPAQSELFYIFNSGGFYSHEEPPADVPGGSSGERIGALPAVCRYIRGGGGPADLQVDVMFHAWLSHAGKEMKRLLCAADAMWRAFDAGLLNGKGLDTPEGRRGALLLTLAGLLEFPADQNFIDGLWSMALDALRLPPISRTLVRNCINEEDHDASNYYGSKRGLRQLLGDLGKSDPLALEQLKSDDPKIGRAREIEGLTQEAGARP
jgi:hypothetical protein